MVAGYLACNPLNAFSHFLLLDKDKELRREPDGREESRVNSGY